MFLAQSPDGKSLALAAETGHVTIIDVETQSVVTTHASHAMCVRALSWSPDSQVSSIHSNFLHTIDDSPIVLVLRLGR